MEQKPDARDEEVLVNPTGPSWAGASHVILAGRARRHSVRDFVGPLSIKSVIRGAALWETARGRFRVEEDSYLVLNEGQRYSIAVDSDDYVETFCVFFRNGFVESAWRSRASRDEILLDDPFGAPSRSVAFPESLRRHDIRVTPVLARMRAASTGAGGEARLDELLYVLSDALLDLRGDVAQEIGRVPALRPATREGLYRRLHRGRGFLDASEGQRPTLALAARAACLSPHHFHRLFTRVFGETPQRYLVRRRLERARRWVARGDDPIGEIARACGFESFGSFSALFRKTCGVSPTEFRRRVRGKKSKPGETRPALDRLESAPEVTGWRARRS